jgi:hypothetical protein
MTLIYIERKGVVGKVLSVLYPVPLPYTSAAIDMYPTLPLPYPYPTPTLHTEECGLTCYLFSLNALLLYII